MMRALAVLPVLVSLAATSAVAAEREVRPVTIPELKAVYGEVQAKDAVTARARLAGTLVSLGVSEGDMVKAGDVIARIVDDKIEFRIKAVDAQLLGLKASLQNAEAELERARQLMKNGAATAQRVDQLQTEAEVTGNRILAAEAERSVLVEQAAEGNVLAPSGGTVLSVPVTRSAVVMAGETVATIAGGGFYLRLAVPERHATALREGAEIHIEAAGKALSGKLAKIYPEIRAGRVTADVEVKDLDTRFTGTRVLVELPVGQRQALLVPAGAVTTRAGLDFIVVSEGGKPVERTVVTGGHVSRDGEDEVEILTGLAAGERIVTP